MSGVLKDKLTKRKIVPEKVVDGDEEIEEEEEVPVVKKAVSRKIVPPAPAEKEVEERYPEQPVEERPPRKEVRPASAISRMDERMDKLFERVVALESKEGKVENIESAMGGFVKSSVAEKEAMAKRVSKIEVVVEVIKAELQLEVDVEEA